MNARVLSCCPHQVSWNWCGQMVAGRFEINQQLFADDAALVAACLNWS